MLAQIMAGQPNIINAKTLFRAVGIRVSEIKKHSLIRGALTFEAFSAVNPETVISSVSN